MLGIILWWLEPPRKVAPSFEEPLVFAPACSTHIISSLYRHVTKFGKLCRNSLNFSLGSTLLPEPIYCSPTFPPRLPTKQNDWGKQYLQSKFYFNLSLLIAIKRISKVQRGSSSHMAARTLFCLHSATAFHTWRFLLCFFCCELGPR